MTTRTLRDELPPGQCCDACGVRLDTAPELVRLCFLSTPLFERTIWVCSARCMAANVSKRPTTAQS